MFVIAAHLAASGSVPSLNLFWRFDLGNLGVRIFFVISGFLITSILLKEDAGEGKINLARFYTRRVLRIGPAYYVFLLAMAVAGYFGAVHVVARDFLPAITFTSNYLFPSFVLGHTWSLSVEEQFYLLWPGALLLLGRRRSFQLAAAIMVLSPIARWMGDVHPSWLGNPRYSFPAVADALACGCLLAAFRDRLQRVRVYRTFVSSIWFGVVPLTIAGLQCAPSPLKNYLLITVTNVLIAMTIDRVIRVPDRLVGRMLNSRPFVGVGVLSYSLYLWQQPFLDPANELAFPLNVVGFFCAACVSYWLIERPVLTWRRAVPQLKEPLQLSSKLVLRANSTEPARSLV
jgi:peptidoglycan/LPS O-acetylase OafA/YrhL